MPMYSAASAGGMLDKPVDVSGEQPNLSCSDYEAGLQAGSSCQPERGRAPRQESVVGGCGFVARGKWLVL